jgi:hypothetical protein
VGSFTGPDADDDGQQMLAERWDGTRWQQVPGPAVAHMDEVLNGVSATSASDAWAVGFTRRILAAARSPLAAHWDGAAWTFVPVPNTAGGAKSVFNAVAAITPSNAWAVGRAKDAHALVEHWDGTAWTVVPVPAPTPPPGWTFTSANLTGISARSATDIWAVGSFNANQSTSTQARTLAMHFDGTAWTVVPTPTGTTVTVNTELKGVTAVAANDVWSVGQASSSIGATIPNPLVIQHWNGRVWSTVATPALQGDLTGVAARSATDVWAVGDLVDGSGTIPTDRTLTLHWNGSAWSVVDSPNGASGDSLLNGVSATPGGGDLWAAGFNLLAPSTYRTLVLRNTP